MFTFYVPTNTSKLVTSLRWLVCYGPFVFLISSASEHELSHHWWSLLLLLMVAFALHWLATQGVDRILLKTTWGEKYLKRQYSWVARQKEYLRSIGEDGNNVYTDTGEFAASFILAIALLICLIAAIAFFTEGDKFRL